MHSHKKTQSFEEKKALWPFLSRCLECGHHAWRHSSHFAVKRLKAKSDRAGRANPSESQWALPVKRPLQASTARSSFLALRGKRPLSAFSHIGTVCCCLGQTETELLHQPAENGSHWWAFSLLRGAGFNFLVTDNKPVAWLLLSRDLFYLTTRLHLFNEGNHWLTPSQMVQYMERDESLHGCYKNVIQSSLGASSVQYLLLCHSKVD